MFQSGYYDSYRELLLNTYTNQKTKNSQISELFTLIWNGEGSFNTWKLVENKSHQVSLLRKDILMFSEVDGLQWLSGRELLNDKVE